MMSIVEVVACACGIVKRIGNFYGDGPAFMVAAAAAVSVATTDSFGGCSSSSLLDTTVSSFFLSYLQLLSYLWYQY